MNKESLKKVQELIRNQLCSIDLSNIQSLLDETITDEEQQERANSVEVFYNEWFEKVFKLLLQKQLEFLGKNASNEVDLLFGRGTINGLFLVHDWFLDQINLSKARFQEKIQEKENE